MHLVRAHHEHRPFRGVGRDAAPDDADLSPHARARERCASLGVDHHAHGHASAQRDRPRAHLCRDRIEPRSPVGSAVDASRDGDVELELPPALGLQGRDVIAHGRDGCHGSRRRPGAGEGHGHHADDGPPPPHEDACGDERA
ncbi:hypothetical protein RWH43_07540 [Microbacterium sp. KSW2-21]|uniref:Uncharacterized protein n=1 Tax=Microbacterium algihabitans TaxID=3075992 RepID=A0ABU3RUX4_9MICO|nr:MULTISPECIES: hypothetical protein [unclassified Microbacterium]MDU0326609.1 hypothetical protein [Microbacterium sp. KSW2-21]